MAVTGFWPVFKNLKATLDYTDNPDKTTVPEYLDEDLYAALRYAENDDKTDRKVFVGGINCSAQNAYAEMIAVQRRFGLRGKVVGYHGIQSFREGEVTPEQAFAIGKETARRMWGDRYQVLVTVHLNTDNVHCHFVVNPVSFKDGAKFKNKIGDHKELRKISDEICREHGLSILENSDFYSKGKKKEYWVHKTGKQTHRDMLRRDVEEAVAKCGSFREIEYYLKCLGYRFQRDFHYTHPSVIIDGWQRPVRIDSLGPQFSREAIRERCLENQRKPELYGYAYPQRKRTDLTSDQVGPKLTAATISETDSASQVKRYIRLTYLIPEFLEKMDNNEIALSVGEELSFLDEQNQRAVLEQCAINDCTPSYSQAWRMHKADREGTLSKAAIQTIMSEEKANQKIRLKIPMERIRKYFPQSYTASQIEDAVVKLCERDYRRRTDRAR